ncbi:MAG: homoserine kinase [Lewinellaceae bacterium]|nr:homoserine kinase [Lewinellaceae bacterium]
MLGIKAFAPASIGNIGIGFDILGMAIEQPGDEVIAKKSNTPGLRITRITGHQGKLPLEVEKNTAGVAALRLLEHLGEPGRGIELEIHKKMPLGSGLGSSAASAVAAVLAVSELLRTGLSKRDLLPFACQGEQVASGEFHADNVAPSLLGGIVLIRDNETLDVHRLHVPRGLHATVVYPQLHILTKDARAILKPEVPLDAYIRQSANIAGFVVGCFNGDVELIGRCLRDEIIEPQRAGLITGFYDVQAAAMTEGALGCSISGAGPSVFALSANSLIAENVGQAMQRAFANHGVESRVFLSGVNQEGAVIC